MLEAYDLLKAMVKKSETRVFFYFFIVWGIVGIFIYTLYLYYSIYTTVHGLYLLTLLLFALIPWGIVLVIYIHIWGEIYLQSENLENWIYFRIRSEWKFTENHSSALFLPISLASLLVAIIPMVFRVACLLALLSALPFLIVLWINCGREISKFGESLNNYMSIVLGLILVAQVWIVYQQYRHMKQPPFKTPLFWTLSKSHSDTDCCILLKNGENVPIFNISYNILEVLVKDGWVYKKVKSEKISHDFLPILDGGSEKKIFEKPTEEFKEMRLAVNIICAETLDGHSIRMSFYKVRGDMDFHLAGIIRTIHPISRLAPGSY